MLERHPGGICGPRFMQKQTPARSENSPKTLPAMLMRRRQWRRTRCAPNRARRWPPPSAGTS
ncbi:hypothetical protein [Streptomyces sp. NPDC005408]|uniref:hypothetical protein n=1 Tax=Streptomyces sp. NPDC005408 TaxID=3155341 RepID=UPI0033AC716F